MKPEYKLRMKDFIPWKGVSKYIDRIFYSGSTKDFDKSTIREILLIDYNIIITSAIAFPTILLGTKRLEKLIS